MPPGPGSPVAIDVLGNLGVALAHEAAIVVQGLLREPARIVEMTVSGGGLAHAKPVSGQSCLLGDAPRDRSIVVAADRPWAHLFRDCEVIDRLIAPRSDARHGDALVSDAQAELDLSDAEGIPQPGSAEVAAYLGRLRHPNRIAEIAVEQDAPAYLIFRRGQGHHGIGRAIGELGFGATVEANVFPSRVLTALHA